MSWQDVRPPSTPGTSRNSIEDMQFIGAVLIDERFANNVHAGRPGWVNGWF